MAEQKRKGLSRLNKAILFLITSAFFFALMNMFVRLSGDVPTIQKTFFRNFFALFIASGAMIKNRCCIIPPKGARFDLFMRAACGYAGVVLNFYAIDRLSISDASLLNKMSPFFAIIFSTFLLKERANKVQWAIILTAFIGALFVIKPSFQNAELGASIAGFCGGMCAGAAYTFVRRATGKGVKSYYVVFFFSAFSTLVAFPLMLLAAALSALTGVLTRHGGQRSRAGGRLLGQVLGFRQFLRRVTPSHLLMRLQRDPQYFYRTLPYAEAMGLGAAFARKFGDTELDPCEWYNEPNLPRTAEGFYEKLKETLALLNLSIQC